MLHKLVRRASVATALVVPSPTRPGVMQFYTDPILLFWWQPEIPRPTNWGCMKPRKTWDQLPKLTRFYIVYGSEIRRLHQLRLLVYPVTYRGFIHPRWLFGISEASMVNSMTIQVFNLGILDLLVWWWFEMTNKTPNGDEYPGRIRKKTPIKETHVFGLCCLLLLMKYWLV